MSERKIINAVSKNRVPQWGNKKKYIAVHYLGVVGQNHDLSPDGSGAHFYIYWDGTIYQRCSLDAVVWAVGTAGVYKQKHPEARNANTISIEMCCKCDGNSASAEDKKWYFTKETQEACVWLVQKLMRENGIPADHVLRHYDIVNKTCPAPYVHNNKYKTAWTWDEFKSRLTGEQEATTGTQTSEFAGLSETAAAARLLEISRPIAEKNDLFASVCAAQTILESGYCTTELAKKANNVCGMKTTLSGNTWPGSTWDGKSKVNIRTPEQDASGNTYYIYADFRRYPCIEDSIADRCAYLLGAQNGSKLRYDGIQDCKNYRDQIELIKRGGYATDVNYVDKICNIIERFDLDKYDQASGEILPDTPDQQWYRVRKSWADAKSQIGAYHNLTKAKKCADDHPGYRVYDESGTQIYPPAAQISGDIIAVCKVFQKQLKADIAAGKSWEYRNPSKYLEEQWNKALKKGKRACNCALLARWALKEAGLIPQDTGIFYGKLGGTISWGAGTKAAVTKTCDLIKIGNKTVKQLITSGDLQPGDIVTYVTMQHTNIYAGSGKWYDAGHAYCKGSGEGATYKSWYGDGQYDNQRVGYIIRRRASSNEYIVQAGVFAVKANAEKLFRKLKKAGFDALIKKRDAQWVVQCGVFSVRKNAKALVKRLKAAGFSAIIK
ncbi:glucosaminidase domain-containing protein [Parablautia sp. Marseille-Q6255]|uniref:glucosaminidase domain-containing protein n=1 Tax=Parablautia sp. Marseille-Q6255 TaxID=3039593 RepID=UPI0024BC0CAB|nr:glucosaminidase domain-containing protein [Parablautia sp. Marseille-Q6255]